MTVLLILATILLVFVLISLVRVGGEVSYNARGLRVRLRVGRLRIVVFPPKPRKKKERTKGEAPPVAATEEPPAQAGNTWAVIREFIPLVSEAAGRFKQKIRVDRLNIDLTVAAGDPAMAAMAYGAANAAIGMMIPLLEQNFRIKERNVNTRCDFDRCSPTAALDAAFSLTVGQGVALSLALGLRVFHILRQSRNHKGNEAA